MAVAVSLAWLIWSPAFAPGQGWRTWCWPLRRARWWEWLGALLAALAGAWMLLLYNLQGWGTLRLFRRNLRRTELYGVNNLDVFTNMRTVFGHDLRQFLDGSWFADVLGEAGQNPLGLPALLVAVALLLWLATRRQLPYAGRRLALLGLFLVSIVAQSAFTPTSLGANHLVIAWPLPQALVAAALVGLAEWPKPRWASWGWGVAGALLLLLASGEAGMTWAYHRVLAQTGGVRHSSDAIYALARDVQAPDALRPVLLDWGWGHGLRLLTGGQVAMDERYDYSSRPGAGFAAWINRRVVAGPGLYLLHPPQVTVFGGHAEVFVEAAYRHRLAPVLAKTYTQRDGVPVYLAYRLEPLPRRHAAPPIPHRLAAELGEQIALLGHDLAATPRRAKTPLTVTLYWQARARPTRSYKVFAHLLDSAGRLVAQYDGVPVLWGYPTTAWEPDEVVEDRLKLPLAGVARGEYSLVVGMYDKASGERLPLRVDGERLPSDALRLGPVTVE
jgi:hypothetical protein